MRLPFIETMITQACNISCLGCTNYSDLRHSGYVSWHKGRCDIESWLARLDIDEFGIMGGEPLINPEWRQWLLGVRSLMPDAQLRFTTNGLLLPRAPDIMDICEAVGNMVLKITVHVDDGGLEHSIDQIMQCQSWQPVTEHGIRRWIGRNGVRLQINRPQQFLKTYRNHYADMAPWNSDPAEAFALCCQQTCPLLYRGRIYKCSTSALLADTLARVGTPNAEQWQPFMTQGIATADPDHVIQEFCDNFGRPNAICGQCPSDPLASIDHKTHVIFKKRTVANDADSFH